MLFTLSSFSFAMNQNRDGGCVPGENLKQLISRDEIKQRVIEIAQKTRS